MPGGTNEAPFLDNRCKYVRFGSEAHWKEALPVELGDFVDTRDEEWDYWEAREVSVNCTSGSVRRGKDTTVNMYLEGNTRGTFCDGNILLFISGERKERLKGK